MQLLGNMEQVTGNLLVLLLHVITDLGNPMDCHTDPIMDIAVGNTLGQFSQFLGALALQLFADAALGDSLQYPLDIRCSVGVSGPLVVIVLFHCAALWCGERGGIGQGDAPCLLLRYGLAGTRRGLSFHRCPLSFQISGSVGFLSLCRLFFLLSTTSCSVRFRFFLLLACIGGQLCGGGTGAGSRSTPASTGRRAAGDRCRFTRPFCAAASQRRKQLLKRSIGSALTTALFRLISHILAVIHKVLDVRPAADQYDIGGTASVSEVLTDQGCVQVPQQGKDRLDSFICK